MSRVISSPSSTDAIGPPRIASGATCPAIKPWVAPEKRPTVGRPTRTPNPSPTRAGGWFQGIGRGTDDLLAGGLDRLVCLLADRPAGDGDRVAVQHSGLVEPLRQHADAARLVEVLGDEPAARLQVAEERRALGDPV